MYIAILIKDIVVEESEDDGAIRYIRGTVVQREEKIRNIFRFTGEQYDQLTSQYYLKARYYNPVIGRFTQMDTYLGDGLNLYAYVQNNPVRYVDPSGHSLECPKVNGVFYHSCADEVADIIADTGFRTDIPNEVDAFKNNRYGRGVYLSDTSDTALAERPGGAILKVNANVGKNLNLTNRGVIGGKNYTMTHKIARGARKHGYDSITFRSAEKADGVNTVIFNPKNIEVEEIMR